MIQIPHWRLVLSLSIQGRRTLHGAAAEDSGLRMRTRTTCGLHKVLVGVHDAAAEALVVAERCSRGHDSASENVVC